MKKMKYIFSFYFLLAMIACGNSTSTDVDNYQNEEEGSSESISKKEGNVSISGKIKNADGKWIYFEKIQNRTIKKIDSALIKRGKFNLDLTISGVDFYRMALSMDDFFILIVNEGMDIKVEADGNDLQGTYTIEGSPESSDYKEFNDEIIKFQSSFEATDKALKASKSQQESIEAQKKMESLKKEFNVFVQNFAKEHTSSLAVLAALGNLDYKTNKELFNQINKDLSAKYPDSEYVKNLGAQIKTMEQQAKQPTQATVLKVGSPAPEINLDNPEGKKVALSSLKGNYVLIDFWASWCGPCRKENPNVVKMYKKYNESGFEIYSVSLDKNKQRWLGAIKQDNLTWTHVSDLKGWASSAAATYGVKGIPFTVLIDKQGNIIATGLRGHTLEGKLKELFGF